MHVCVRRRTDGVDGRPPNRRQAQSREREAEAAIQGKKAEQATLHRDVRACVRACLHPWRWVVAVLMMLWLLMCGRAFSPSSVVVCGEGVGGSGLAPSSAVCGGDPLFPPFPFTRAGGQGREGAGEEAAEARGAGPREDQGGAGRQGEQQTEQAFFLA